MTECFVWDACSNQAIKYAMSNKLRFTQSFDPELSQQIVGVSLESLIGDMAE